MLHIIHIVLKRVSNTYANINDDHSLGKFNRLQIDILFFSQKIDIDISCKLCPKETICMKCQSLLSGKKKKNISKHHLLKSLPKMIIIKTPDQPVKHFV